MKPLGPQTYRCRPACGDASSAARSMASAPAAVVEVEMHLLGEGRGRDAVAKGRALARARAVVHLEVRAGHGQPLGHAQDRRDADAAGQQQVALRLVGQREVVLRRADLQHVAFAHQFVHRQRAAARGRVAQHADQVAVRLGRVVAQRVLARQAVRQVHVDVRAGRERRQRRAVHADQLESEDVLGLPVLARDPDRQRRAAHADGFRGDQPIDHLARLHAAGIDVQPQHLALGPAQQVALLALEHLEVFAEDLALAFADLRRQRLVAAD